MITTERLYFDDPYLRDFDARIVGRTTQGGQPAVALDRSAFYPEGGGQPGDHGTLNDVEVLDTQADGEVVWHILASAVSADSVHGTIDWTHRFDLMQQHHGQHLLSAAFEQLFDTATVSVHIGAEICTVDLASTALTAEHLAAAETLANTMIWENHPINARFVDRADLSALALRKPPGDYAQIRIVSVAGFDHSACGGTHPRHTGEVGQIVIRRWERRGDTLRVEFVCGGRALRDYRQKNSLVNGLAADLSVGLVELPAAIERLREAETRSRKALATAEQQLLGYEAAALLAQAEQVGGVPIVVQRIEDRDLESLRRLARLIADGGGVALLGLAGPKAQLVFTRAANAPYDMGAALREAAAIVGGRGGGRPEAAQGGGPDGTRLSEALAHARAMVEAWAAQSEAR